MKPLIILTALTTIVLAALPARAMTDAQEAELSVEVTRRVEERWGGVLPDGDPLTRRVQRLGKAMSRLASRPNIQYSFKVLNNDRVLNAFSAPGGHIYITRGLVKLTVNDAELAAVLGHETAHTDRRHIAATFEKYENSQHAASAFSDRYFGKGVDGIGRSLVTIGTAAAFVLWSPAYSRSNESEADAYSARWMSRLGLDPRAEISILEKASRKSKLPEVSSFLASHPAPLERSMALTHLIAQENLLAVAQKYGGPTLWWVDKSAPPQATTRQRIRHFYRTSHKKHVRQI